MMVVPQLFVAGPHALPIQAAVSFAVQPQPLAPALPPPHVLAPVQVFGHMMVAPQLFVAGPHALPTHAAALSGTHWHWVIGLPTQDSFVAHAVHLAVSPQPLFASGGTHLLPHFLVPEGQVPTTHDVPWQTSVPEPADGQVVASHVVAPQP
jgi:hypothetical protein